MANNIFQVKRTSTAGRTPNTTGSYATNSQYIAAGEFALNMADQILYTSDGTKLIIVGATQSNATVNNHFVTSSLTVGNVFIGTNSAVNINATTVAVGNSTVNGSISTNSSVAYFTGTSYNALNANNALYLGGTASNLYALTSSLSAYQTTAGLSANVATLTSNNTSYVGSVSAANVVSNAQLAANLANYTNTAGLSGYQTNAGLVSNVATLTANNTSFVGTVSAANVVSNAQLSANLSNYALLSGAAFTGNVSISGNLIVTGTTVTVNAATLDVKDINITVAKGAATAAAADGAGLTVDTAGIGWYYNNASNTWQSNVGITPSANVTYNLGSSGLYWANIYSNNVYLSGTINAVSHTTGSGSGSAAGGITVNSSVITIGNSTVNLSTNSTHFYSGNSTYYGYGNSTADVLVNPTGNLVLTPTSITIANTSGNTFVANTIQITINGTPLSANGSNGTATWVLTSNGSLGSPYWATPASATFSGGSVSGVSYFNANVVVNNASGSVNLFVNAPIVANGGVGTSGQVLTSSAGGNVYWSTVTSGGGGSFTNGASIAVSNIAYTNTTGTSVGVAYQFINTISGSLDTVFS